MFESHWPGPVGSPSEDRHLRLGEGGLAAFHSATGSSHLSSRPFRAEPQPGGLSCEKEVCDVGTPTSFVFQGRVNGRMAILCPGSLAGDHPLGYRPPMDTARSHGANIRSAVFLLRRRVCGWRTQGVCCTIQHHSSEE